MTATQRRRKQTNAKTKTPRRPKAPTAAFWAERAAKIAAARARNERSGMTERERRAQRKAARAKQTAKGAKTTKGATTRTTTPAPTTTKTTKTPRPDVSSGAYIARVLKAIDKSTTKAQRAYVVKYLGADGGAGWAVLGTDGVRALLQVGPITNDAKIARPLVTATGPAFGIDLTADVERALRTLDGEALTLQIDAQRKRLTVSGSSGVPAVSGPITGTLKSATLLLNRRWLLDGLGRGGRLRYDAKPDRIVIDTPDALRYVLMKMQPPPTVPKRTPAPPTKTTTKHPKTKTTPAPTTTPPVPAAAAAAPATEEPTTTAHPTTAEVAQ